MTRRRRWGLLAALGALTGLASNSVVQALHGIVQDERWSWADQAVAVALWACLWPVVMVGVRTAQDRGWLPTDPGTFRSVPVRAALRAGALPPWAVGPVWRRALLHEADQLDRSCWVFVGILAVAAASAGWAATVANDGDWRVWVVAAVLAAAGALVWTWLGGEREKATRLADSLPGDL